MIKTSPTLLLRTPFNNSSVEKLNPNEKLNCDRANVFPLLSTTTASERLRISVRDETTVVNKRGFCCKRYAERFRSFAIANAIPRIFF